MTPEQLRVEEVRAWIDRARHDLHSAELLIAGQECGDALFRCQQAAEKALKAYLTLNEHPFQKTHDLGQLTSICVVIDPTLEPDLARAESLTQFAWRFRYPGAPFQPNAAEAEDGFKNAEAVVRDIARRLPR